jgi:hypothetical protein
MFQTGSVIVVARENARGQKVQLFFLSQDVLDGKLPEAACEDSHQREAVLLLGMWQIIRPVLQPFSAQETTRREKVYLFLLQQVICQARIS